MTTATVVRNPRADELSKYYQTYMHYVPAGNMLDLIEKQRTTTREFLASVPSAKETFRYASEKWSIREVAGHVCDTERIMGWRALCIARKDPNSLPGFEENDYTRNANYNEQPLSQIAEHLDAVRAANILMFRSFSESMYDNTGTANALPVSVRGLLFFTIAHQAHHLGVIRDRYLKG